MFLLPHGCLNLCRGIDEFVNFGGGNLSIWISLCSHIASHKLYTRVARALNTTLPLHTPLRKPLLSFNLNLNTQFSTDPPATSTVSFTPFNKGVHVSKCKFSQSWYHVININQLTRSNDLKVSLIDLIWQQWKWKVTLLRCPCKV